LQSSSAPSSRRSEVASSLRSNIEEFVRRAPDFYADLGIADLDEKHAKIVGAAYEQLKDLERASRNFRSWSAQSDMTVPGQLSWAGIKANGLSLSLAKYIYAKTLKRSAYEAVGASIADDIAVLKMVGGSDLLRENPVHLTPGARDFYFVEKTSVSTRWLRYLYLLRQIQAKELLPEAGLWVDVGSYYGGLQGLVRKYHPKVRMVLVDFHHQLCRSYVYLKTLYPDAEHVFPDQISAFQDLDSLPPGTIAYLPARSFDLISEHHADLVSNFFSLGEMRRSVFESYYSSRMFRSSSRSYIVNRVVSSPFFEGTYDSDISMLDYIRHGQRVLDFDIFPMHHYMLIERKVLGTTRLRNVSSPYFEMVATPSDEDRVTNNEK